MIASRQIASKRALAAARRSYTIKTTATDAPTGVSQLQLVVKGGSRAAAPGVAHALEKFAYKNTAARSALRLVRESELLGGQLSSTLTRENIVLTAKFLKEDLPYYVNVLADVAQNTLYKQYELDEDVLPLAKHESAKAAQNPLYVATEKAHEVAFRAGLGNALLYEPYSPVTLDAVKDLAAKLYNQGNVELIGHGVVPKDLDALVASSAFAQLGGAAPVPVKGSAVFGGESRVGATSGNAIVLAFPAAQPAAPALFALAKALGAKSTIKWSQGQSPLGSAAAVTGASIVADVHSYSDASLFTISVSGPSAATVAAGAKAAVAALSGLENGLSEETTKRAVALAKFDAVETASAVTDFAAVSLSSLKTAAADLLKGPKVVSAVGQIHELPYADELV